MVRETRHLWVGNLPENIREDRIREHFKRYGRVQSVKLLPRAKEEDGSTGLSATVAFMDIKSAAKAHNMEHKLEERCLSTSYYEPPLYAAAPRFPHGVPDEHVSGFDRSALFYERSREGDAYLRRQASNYHVTAADPLRGRTRDRLYRNGLVSYTQIIDRPPISHHRALGGNAWNYEGTNSRYPSVPPTPEPYPDDRRDPPTPAHKKRPKSSRSGSESGSNSGSSRSRSRSRSRSSSSSSNSGSSSCSSGTSSPVTGSPHSSRTARSGKAVQSTVSAPHNNSSSPAVHSEDRRPLAICVRNLPIRSSDTSLKDGLFHEYKKHGKVTWVKVVGQGQDRYALVCFKKPEDVEKALEVSHDKLFFGCKIEVASYQGYDVDDNESRPYEAELDEFHPKATRTLFIGNLEKDVTATELRKHFEQFGEIIEIDIKKQGAVSSYAFCQYSDIASVVKAMRTMDGEHLGNNRIKLGFGKSMPTNCVWVDGVADNVSEKYLNLQFNQFGSISHVTIDRERGHALIYFEQIPSAQDAVRDMRGVMQRGRKLQVDFASRECQEAFYEHLEKQGHAVVGGERPWDRYDNTREVQASRFDTTVVVPGARFPRYETPLRPRTSTYTRTPNNTGAAATAGSASTPGQSRGGGRGQRPGQRYSEYYDPEYPERRYSRGYDDVSQGSPASHEGSFEHDIRDYGYGPRTSPTPSGCEGEGRRSASGQPEKGLPDDDGYKRLQSVVVSDVAAPPPDMRHLQKERVHLLEQLEECASSGDDDIAPKKRTKVECNDLGMMMPGNCFDLTNHDTPNLVVTTHNHRKSVSEVRRLSDASLKHCSRRPSNDSRHMEVPLAYAPHPVCKRRKTGSSASEGEDRLGCRKHVHHHHHHSGDQDGVDGSRPGTPLCDERPENLLPPSEPRRPRERLPEGPLSLPLPRFAAQILSQRALAGKPVVVSPPASTSPRVPALHPPPSPSPSPAPPPSSPPPRPPSLPDSSSSDSELSPPSPTLEERIRSVTEMYEKWSGSRNLTAPSETSIAKLDATSERFRLLHKPINFNELKPSDIVKSVLAKPSVFDEDSKRLENVGDKYEPKEFVPFKGTGCFQSLRIKTECSTPAKTPTTPQPVSFPSPALPSRLVGMSSPLHSPNQPPPKSPFSTGTPTTPTSVKSLPMSPGVTSAPPPCKLTTIPKTGALSPRAAGSGIPAAKGLQYPFPSHPPVLPTTTVATTTATNVMALVSVSVTIPSTGMTYSPEVSRTCVVKPVGVSGALSDPRSRGASSVMILTTATATKPSPEVLCRVQVPQRPDTSATASAKVPVVSRPGCLKPVTTSIPSTGTVSSAEVFRTISVKGPGSVISSDETGARLPIVASFPSLPPTQGHGAVISGLGSVKVTCAVTTTPITSTRTTPACIRPTPSATPTSSTSVPSLPRLGKITEHSPKISKESNPPPPRLETLQSESNIPTSLSDPSSTLAVSSSVSTTTVATSVATVETSSTTVPTPSIATTNFTSTTNTPTTSVSTDSQRQSHKPKTVLTPKPQPPSSKNVAPKKDREDSRVSSSHKSSKSLDERKEKKEAAGIVCVRRESEGKEKKREKDGGDAADGKRKDRDNEERRREWDPAESGMKELEGDKELKKDGLIGDRLSWKDTDSSDNLGSQDKERSEGLEKKKDFPEERWRDNQPVENILKERWKDKEESIEKRKENHIDHLAKDSEPDSKDKKVHDNSDRRRDSEPSGSLDRRKDQESTSEISDKKCGETLDKRKDVPDNIQRRKSTDNVERRKNRESPENIDKRKDREHINNRKEPDRKDRSPTEVPDKKKDRNSTESERKKDREQAEVPEKWKVREISEEKSKDMEGEEKRKDRKKERASSVNSPASIGGKRRMSSQDSIDVDEAKRPKLSERRDSKDSGRSSRSSSKRGPHHSFVKPHEEKTKHEAERKRHEHEKTKDKQKKRAKEQKSKEASEDQDTSPRLTKQDSDPDDKDEAKQKHAKKESNDKKKKSDEALVESQEEKARSTKKDREKRGSSEKRRDEKEDKSSNKREPKHHKHNLTDSDSEDGDGPKKHSIFDIVDDGPAYISMYDKVKARSTKNMQKQEEEKRQEKMREKFSLLKASRAKREEKKRSTSWDEDSDSDAEHRRAKRAGKPVISSSSEDETNSARNLDDVGKGKHGKKEDLGLGDSDSDSRNRRGKQSNSRSEDDENCLRIKPLSTVRKTSRSKLISDTSEDESLAPSFKLDQYSAESDADQGFADSDDRHPVVKKTSKNNKFNKSVMDVLSEETNRKPIPDILKVIKDRNSSFRKNAVKNKNKSSVEFSDDEKSKVMSDSGKSDFFDEVKLSSIFKKSNNKNKSMKVLIDSSDDEHTRKMLADVVKAEIFGEEKSPVFIKKSNKNKVIKRCLDSSDDELARKILSSPKIDVKSAIKNKSFKSSPESFDEDNSRKFLSETEKAVMFGEAIPSEKINSHSKTPSVVGSYSDCEHASMDKKFYENSLEKNSESSRKKAHKKKQKRLKDSQSSPDSLSKDQTIEKHIENKIKSEKKHKRERRKSLHGDDQSKTGKIRKKKTNKQDISLLKPESSLKRDEKMEDIFGPLSDDSETSMSKVVPTLHNNGGRVLDTLASKWQVSLVYGSDSDSVDPSLTNIVSTPIRPIEKERKRREKKRRDRKAREEGSIGSDLAEAGRVLEAKLLDTDNFVTSDVIKRESNDADIFRFTDGDESLETATAVLLEKAKEKKKKRKKSKEEKQNKHHHHHHHDKGKSSPDRKLSVTSEDTSLPALTSPPLPSLEMIPTEVKPVTPNTLSVIPSANCSIPCKISPKSMEKKKTDKFIPGFGVALDDAIHETAVKSISEFEAPKVEPLPKVEESKKEETLIKDGEELEGEDEKPRAVISQEETEDAVAALLGESFGADDYDYEGSGSPPHAGATSTTQPQLQTDEEEETRQAVEGLIDMKPDTPQSEADLQIDTDTEGDDGYVGLRFSSDENNPRTPETIDFSKPPKTPDLPPSYYRNKALEVEATPDKTPPTPLALPKPIPLKIDTPESSDAEVSPTRSKMPPDILPQPALVEEPNKEVIKKEVKVEPEEPETSQIAENMVSTLPVPPVTLKPAIILPADTRPHTLEIDVNKRETPHGELSPSISDQTPVLQSPLPTVIKERTTALASDSSKELNKDSVIKRQEYLPKEEIKEKVQFPEEYLPRDFKPFRFDDLPTKPLEHKLPNNVDFRSGLDKDKKPVEIDTNHEDDFSEPETDMKPDSDIVTNILKSDSLTRNLSIDESGPEIANIEADYRPLCEKDAKPVSVIKEVDPCHKRLSEERHPFALEGVAELKRVTLTLRGEKHSSFLSDVIRADTGFWSAKEVNIDSVIKKVDALCSGEEDTPDESPWFGAAAKDSEVTPVPKLDVMKLEVPKPPEILKTEPPEILKTEPPEILKTEPPEILKTKPPEILKTEPPEILKTKPPSIDLPKVEEPVKSEIPKSAEKLPKEESPMQEVKKTEEEAAPTSPVKTKFGPTEESKPNESPVEEPSIPKQELKDTTLDSSTEVEETNVAPQSGQKSRRGVGGRRKGLARGAANVTTRRTRLGQKQTDGTEQLPSTPRRGRGGKRASRTVDLSGVNQNKLLADVYEFHDDSDDEGESGDKNRPRLILTIKSPVSSTSATAATVTVATTTTATSTTTATMTTSTTTTTVSVAAPPPTVTVSDVPPPSAKSVVEPIDEPTASPAANTRKSRRLQVNTERDGSRNTVDDTIEDVVRGLPILTRSAAASLASIATRRQTRQTNAVQSTLRSGAVAATTEPRKSPRGGKRQTQTRTTSESQDESEVKTKAEEFTTPTKPQEPAKEAEKAPESEKPAESPFTTPVCASPAKQAPTKPVLAAARVVQKQRGDGESEEPMTLIDPVTGLLIPMRESEEGQYIPVTSAGGRTLSESVDVGAIVLDRAKVQDLSSEKPSDQPASTKPTLPASAKPTLPAPLGQVPVIAKPQNVTPPIATTPTLPAPPMAVKPLETAMKPAEPVTKPTEAVTKVTTLKAHVLQQAKNMAQTPLSVNVNVVQQMSKPPPNVPTHKSALSPQPVNLQLPKAQVSPQPIKTAVQTPSIIQPVKNAIVMQTVVQPIKNVVLPQTKVPQPMALTTSPTYPANKIQAMPKGAVVPGAVLGRTLTPINPKAHLLQLVAKPASPVQQVPQQAHLNKVQLAHPGKVVPATASPPKAHQGVGPPPILTGSVASPPLKASQQPIVTGASSSRTNLPKAQMPNLPNAHMSPHGAKGMMIPPKVEVSMGGCIVVPSASPQPSGQVMQAGMPVPAYEASLQHAGSGTGGVVTEMLTNPQFVMARSLQSPPPAHQHGSQGDVVQHVFPHSMRPPPHEMPPHYLHSQLMYQQYLRAVHIPYHLAPGGVRSPLMPGMDVKSEPESEEARGSSPPLELRRPASGGARTGAGAPHSLQSPHDRSTDSPQVATVYMHGARLAHFTPRYYDSEPPPAHLRTPRYRAMQDTDAPPTQPRLQVATPPPPPPHGSQVLPQADPFFIFRQLYPVMWQGRLALKNDQAAVQMHFVFGNPYVARDSLPVNSYGRTPPLRIAQRMRLEQTQVEGVARKMQMKDEHCVLLALPCGHDNMDVLQQSNNMKTGFITYLQQKQAAGIVNLPGPVSQQAAYVVHIFPSCDFVNENLARIAPDLLQRITDLAHLIIIIATV